MGSDRFHNMLSRGLGHAARATGDQYDVHRPGGAFNPLASETLIMTLPVSLHTGTTGIKLPRGYERAIRASFDAVRSHIGDYLRGPRGVLFIAALPALRQPVCVLTNSSVDVLRPSSAAAAGLNGYGGVTEPSLMLMLGDWPVQFSTSGNGKAGELPVDGGQTTWSVLMPPTPLPIQTSDLLQDSSGRRFVVRSAEQSEAGWCLLVRSTEV